jgi:cytochrome c-type biogenesis protein CcmE
MIMATVNKHSPRRQRFQRLFLILLAVSGVTLILLGMLRENIVFFMLPSEFLEKQNLKPGQIIRLGGKVKPGSIHTQGDLLTFTLMDEKANLSVVYKGVVPDLFRDQQGVVVEGTFDSTVSVFKATKLFAKHDETYIPREVVNSLKKQSLWRGS